mmetsp:Transcript_33009/g.77854  ORF Transcript_33009/g.77854 Transcript_33009/m.77854 type:complete len:455 (-) Transcript_33009:81-1445(-)
MSVVHSKSFVPKEKHLGSWDPTSSQWLQNDYTFTAQLWGIKANMEMIPGFQAPKFTHPLIITEVKPGTEAHMFDLRVRDIIVAIKTPDMQDFKRIEGEEVMDAPKKNVRYVPDDIGKVLRSGGPCVVRAQREKKNQVCDGCGSENIVEIRSQGDLVCEDCGLVFRDRLISMSSEWRTFQDDDSKVDPNRAGAAENPLLNSNPDAMSTMIQPSGGGRNHGTDAVGSAANLSKNQFRASAQSHDRALQDAYKEIDRMCERMNLNQNIVKAAQHMYKTVDDELKKGKKALRSTEAIVASTVYIACRDEGVPRTLKELCAVTSATKKDIGKTFKQVQQLLHKTVQPMKASDIITRFCSNLGLSATAERGAIDIAEAAGQHNITEGRVYTSIAGAAIFMACLLRQGTDDAKKTCFDISQATGAAEATIRQTFRDMHAKRALLVPESFATRQQVEIMPDH